MTTVIPAIVLHGDARALPLPDASVDLVVTSPPYFGQRSYRDGGQHFADQVGAEDTPTAYVDTLIDCTREWMRLLKPGGSLWVNLGDKYGGSSWETKQGRGNRQTTQSGGLTGGKPYIPEDERTGTRAIPGTRHKCLLGLPWRYALRCTDELGLILRAEVIWSKPNGMPESVADRVGRSHEQWFHLVQQPRYFAAVDEVRQPHAAPGRHHGTQAMAGRNANLPRSSTGAYTGPNPLGKLLGSVWNVATEPLRVPDALGIDHFAAFPTEMPRRIILGWSPSSICTSCGEGRRPVISREGIQSARSVRGARERLAAAGGRITGGTDRSTLRGTTIHTPTGTEACACAEPTATSRPAIVLDPFGGTGTTALVASVLGRVGITVDRSSDYCRIAQWRTTDPGQIAKAMGAPKAAAELPGQADILADLADVA